MLANFVSRHAEQYDRRDVEVISLGQLSHLKAAHPKNENREN
jgi:hypothetical protein